MASCVLIHLLLTVVLFHMTAASCKSYVSSSGVYKDSLSCGFTETCCGTCDYRYCCSAGNNFTEEDQDACFTFAKSHGSNDASIGMVITLVVIIVIVVLICRCWRRCCLYNLCRKPRTVVVTTPPAAAAATTTVINMQSIVPVAQYPAYQPVSTQPGYGGQPYPAQPCAQGPPPSYQTAGKNGK
nr:protein shisa-5-like [Misgurnus anguillicaudatus]